MGELSGVESPKVRPLRPGDPLELGTYRLTGRLGEGGMGSVYLASAADGRLVAIKVIRDELADNAEFRRRFRSEVARAREVPPFCTAEVIDADTEHEPPFLVVEYVDGPSLATVVRDRGPLTPANQHGLAVGVAVALTAIHGAGVIHRDLKPSNVLLAPGSPKVIDFGIARGMDHSDADTRTDQVVGTVAYMAPERFGGKSSGPLSPASDIFSWGAVIAFAATGRTPFGAEVPAAIAVKIMNDPPDLDGLSGPLRDLVEASLAKNPADRPTARELLDNLLAGGGSKLAGGAPAPTRTTAFPQQPEVLAAAGLAGAVTALTPIVALGQVSPDASGATVPGGATMPVGSMAAGPMPTMPIHGVPHTVPLPVPPQRGPGPQRPPYGPPRPPGPAGPRRRPQPEPPARGRAGTIVAISLLAVAILVLAGTVAAVATGILKLPGQGESPAANAPTSNPVTASTATTASTPPASASATDGPSVDPTGSPPTGEAAITAGMVSVIDDKFPPGDTYWPPASLPAAGGACTVDNALTATLTESKTVAYRCKGIDGQFSNVAVIVNVALTNDETCAGVWLRYSDAPPGGYAAKICRDRIQIVTHSDKIVVLREFPYPSGVLAANQAITVGFRVQDNLITVYRDGQVLGSVTDDTYPRGRVVLGVFGYGVGSPAPYQAVFHRVQIFAPPA